MRKLREALQQALKQATADKEKAAADWDKAEANRGKAAGDYNKADAEIIRIKKLLENT